MKLRNFLRILIPVCALAAVSCTNEELIVDASQSPRGRAFAEAFKARFDNIDPNHTWVDGTFGKVMVTTGEKANIVIYGLGRSDNAAIRLKRCVVEGTQEVHYDIPAGCKKVVLRAYNQNGNEYKTLDPSNENDEATLLVSTRASIEEDYNLSPIDRQKIPNVWNEYGSTAPWQTVIPNLHNDNIIAKYDMSGNHITYVQWFDGSQIPVSALEWCFYFFNGGKYYNIYNPSASGNETLIAPDASQPNTRVQGLFKANFIPTSLFSNSDEDFCSETGFSSADKVTTANGEGYWQVVYINSNTIHCDFESLDGNKTYVNNDAYLPEGWYYNFDSFGKRSSWLDHRTSEYGDFYVSNITLSDEKPSGTDDLGKHSGADILANTSQFYNIDLNVDVIDEILDIINRAENNYDVLAPFVTEEGESLTTTLPGPVTVSWFYSETTTRDFIGYYYVKHIDGESVSATQARCKAAPKYLLLEATCTDTRHVGDTFPLTFYGDDGNSKSFDFPEGYDIHFFILHGRDSRANNVNPHSGPNYNWDNSWRTGDPNYETGLSGLQPGSHNSRNSWLFYDEAKSDRIYDKEQGKWITINNPQENGWTLNAFYTCYSEGGDANDVAMLRIMEKGANCVPDARIPKGTPDDGMHYNYLPMARFRYGGYNVIGFEDTPIGYRNLGNQGWDLDWNDCIFLVNGNFDIPDYNEKDLAFSMCMEDLGDTEDLDYNDLYMIVIQGYDEMTSTEWDGTQNVTKTTIHYAPPKVIVDMAGGVLPLKIVYEDDVRFNLNQTLFEDVHKAFGKEYANDEDKYATPGDRTTINTYDPDSDDPKNPHNTVYINNEYTPGEISTVTFTDGSIVNCTNLRSLGDPAKIGHIETWFDANIFTQEDLASFSIIENIPNFKIYVKYNEGTSDEETVCVSGPKNIGVNIGVNTDKIPYAFWFPATAESEQESNENQETRVHPGFERQFIGDYLDDFNTWVANQDLHGDKKWYDWSWGSDDAWPDNKPVIDDGSSSGTGTGTGQGNQGESSSSYWKKIDKSNYSNFKPFGGYYMGGNYIYLPPEFFKLFEADGTTEKTVTKIEIKVNYDNLNYHFCELRTRANGTELVSELVNANNKMSPKYTATYDPNHPENATMSTEETNKTVIQVLQENGLAISWYKDGTAQEEPVSIQYHVE